MTSVNCVLMSTQMEEVMQPITKRQRNSLIDITCDYFKTLGIMVIPDMFVESEDQDEEHKFIMKDTWYSYTIDADLSMQYSVNFYIEAGYNDTDPDCFALSITNNGGLEHYDEYKMYHIKVDTFNELIDKHYESDILNNPLFNNWV